MSNFQDLKMFIRVCKRPFSGLTLILLHLGKSIKDVFGNWVNVLYNEQTHTWTSLRREHTKLMVFLKKDTIGALDFFFDSYLSRKKSHVQLLATCDVNVSAPGAAAVVTTRSWAWFQVKWPREMCGADRIQPLTLVFLCFCWMNLPFH